MKTYTIDAENNIMAHASAAEAIAGAESFTTQIELNKLAANWPVERLVEIWNSLPGSAPLKKFKDHKTAVGRIWKAIAGLGEPPTKASVAPQVPDVAPAKPKSGKKASPPQQGPKAKNAEKPRKAAKSADKAPPAPRVAPKGTKAGKRTTKAEKPATARQGSKTQQILDLLKRPGGASLKQIMAATDWQAHSVCGFISGTLGKKMGLDVESVKGEDGARTYSLKA